MSDWSAGQPPGGRRARPNRAQPRAGYDYYGGRRQPPQQPPPTRQYAPRQRGGEHRPPAAGPPAPPGRRAGNPGKRWGRRIGITLVVVLALLVGLVFYLDTSLQRTSALDYPGRGADTKGTNWLLLGSDSRQGLSQDQRDELSTGNVDDAGGARTDTMMLVHIPEGGGQPAMISLPRDSLVPIAGTGERDKLNSAFNGGPQRLVQTIENVSGVHIDHYAEVGLGGFADLVDAVGGVDMCIEEPLRDPAAGLDLQPGCQELNGAQALGFVRSRNFARGDLQRIENQRKLLGALIDKSTSPGTLFNPFRLVPLANGATKTFVVNDGDHIWHLGSLAMAMGDISGGQGVTTTVPFGGFGENDDGQSVVLWDRENASRMFEALANDTPIPPDVLEK